MRRPRIALSAIVVAALALAGCEDPDDTPSTTTTTTTTTVDASSTSTTASAASPAPEWADTRSQPVGPASQQPAPGGADRDGVLTDTQGYLVTGRDLFEPTLADDKAAWRGDREPYPLETSRPGLFAVGDVRHGSTKRVAAAVGEGAMAVGLVHRFLAERRAARPS